MSDPTPDQRQKLRAWIQSGAETKTLDEIREWVVARMEGLCAAAIAIPDAALTTSPGENDWSALDILKHAVEWNWQVGEDVLHVSLMGERPGNPLPVFEPDRAGLIARQKESLESIWAHVSAADPAGFLDMTWEHPFFGQLNWREWYFFLGVHAADHSGQLASLREALGG